MFATSSSLLCSLLSNLIRFVHLSSPLAEIGIIVNLTIIVVIQIKYKIDGQSWIATTETEDNMARIQ